MIPCKFAYRHYNTFSPGTLFIYKHHAFGGIWVVISNASQERDYMGLAVEITTNDKNLKYKFVDALFETYMTNLVEVIEAK